MSFYHKRLKSIKGGAITSLFIQIKPLACAVLLNIVSLCHF